MGRKNRTSADPSHATSWMYGCPEANVASGRCAFPLHACALCGGSVCGHNNAQHKHDRRSNHVRHVQARERGE